MIQEIFKRFDSKELYSVAFKRFENIADSRDLFEVDSKIYLQKQRQIIALAVVHEDYVLNGSVLEVAGVKFQCKAFERIDKDCIKQVIFSILSLNAKEYPEEPEADETSLIGEFYANAWENTLLWAGGYALKKEIESAFGERQLFLSEPFSPGIGGMDISENKKMAKILDIKKADVYVNESGRIDPPISCTGIYFVANDRYAVPQITCCDCEGSKSGCVLCAKYRKVV